jgi:hypothetical protein
VPTGIEVEKDIMKTKHPQLELALAETRKTMTPEQACEHIIKLYGAEFDKANDEIARLKQANDEMFKIKQKIVIVNRELLRKLEHADDLDFSYNNDAKFRMFVDRKCAQAIELLKIENP